MSADYYLLCPTCNKLDAIRQQCAGGIILTIIGIYNAAISGLQTLDALLEK